MFTFHTDDYFAIGTSHINSGKPCQDHALSGAIQNAAYGIIADGCSSGRHTDVGSRLLTLSTAKVIRQHALMSAEAPKAETINELHARQNIVLSGMKDTMDLQLHDLLATCAFVYVTPNGGVIHVHGDGVLAIKYRAGGIAMSRFDWANNMPFYPAYSGREEDLEAFIQAHGGDLSKTRMTEEHVSSHGMNSHGDSNYTNYSLSDAMHGINVFLTAEDLNAIEFIAVFSDGVTQVEGVDWKDAVMTFMSFKNTAGNFAKRRMMSGIRKMKKDHRGPIDDISYAVVQVSGTYNEPNTEEGE